MEAVAAAPKSNALPHRIVEATCVIIPALNEEEALPRVLTNLREIGLRHIRVVDNGSTDNTAQVAALSGAEVRNEARRGYGAACWQGKLALGDPIEWILFCDADGSDDLSELDLFFVHAACGYDLVLGNRRARREGKKAMTPQQNFGNWLATTLILFGWKHRYQDLGPLRLIRRQSLERIAMKDRGFGWTVEMQVRAVEEGLRITEIPVNYRNRQGGQSKISRTVCGAVNAGTVILLTLLKLYLRRIFR